MTLRAASLLAFICLAVPTAASCGTTGFTNQGSISTAFSGTGSLDLRTSGITSPMGCSMSNNYRLPSSTQNFAATASLIMTGFAAGKQVAFYVSGCDTDGSSIISSAIVIY
jgi:hypothetical protein